MNINPVESSPGRETFCFEALREKAPEFEELWEKLTGGGLAQKIREDYHITLEAGKMETCRKILEDSDIRCTNYVRISPETLQKMEEDPVLKKKILRKIEEFCSDREQEKIKNLCPPVKSGGMLIDPEGNTLYWLEAYSTETDHKNSKKPIAEGQALSETSRLYQDIVEFLTEKILLPEYGILGEGSGLRRSADEERKRSAVYL